ncbi:hypothetical protein D3C87_1828340 [compost metagenome]
MAVVPKADISVAPLYRNNMVEKVRPVSAAYARNTNVAVPTLILCTRRLKKPTSKICPKKSPKKINGFAIKADKIVVFVTVKNATAAVMVRARNIQPYTLVIYFATYC